MLSTLCAAVLPQEPDAKAVLEKLAAEVAAQTSRSYVYTVWEGADELGANGAFEGVLRLNVKDQRNVAVHWNSMWGDTLKFRYSNGNATADPMEDGTEAQTFEDMDSWTVALGQSGVAALATDILADPNRVDTFLTDDAKVSQRAVSHRQTEYLITRPEEGWTRILVSRDSDGTLIQEISHHTEIYFEFINMTVERHRIEKLVRTERL